jgi:hypothetical protein
LVYERTSKKFDELFNGTIVLDQDIEDKLFIKHKAYRDDLADAFGDPYLIAIKPKQISA